MKNEKKNIHVFLFQKYINFWRISLDNFIKNKSINSEEWYSLHLSTLPFTISVIAKVMEIVIIKVAVWGKRMVLYIG